MKGRNLVRLEEVLKRKVKGRKLVRLEEGLKRKGKGRKLVRLEEVLAGVTMTLLTESIVTGGYG